MTTIVEIDTETDPVKRDTLVGDLRKLLSGLDVTFGAPKSASIARFADNEQPAEPETPPVANE